jgi:hypothetical protein
VGYTVAIKRSDAVVLPGDMLLHSALTSNTHHEIRKHYLAHLTHLFARQCEH